MGQGHGNCYQHANFDSGYHQAEFEGFRLNSVIEQCQCFFGFWPRQDRHQVCLPSPTDTSYDEHCMPDLVHVCNNLTKLELNWIRINLSVSPFDIAVTLKLCQRNPQKP